MIITFWHLWLIISLVTNTTMTEFASETQPVVHPAQRKMDPVNLEGETKRHPNFATPKHSQHMKDEFLLMIETWIFYDIFKSHMSHS